MTESPDVLTGGSWQTIQGVLRWVPERWVPDPRTRVRVADLLACPTCRAKAGNACRTPCGTSTAPHTSRLVARYCGCGEKLGPRQRLCPPCRREARLETFRSYDQRRGPRDRRAAA